MGNAWKRQRVPFNYLLGDKRILAFDLVLQTYTVGLSDAIQPMPTPAPPTQELDTALAGYMIRWLPIGLEQRRVQWKNEYIRYVATQDPRYYIDMSGTFDDYQRRFSSKSRWTIKKKIRKFADYCGGRIRWCSYKTVSEIADFYRLARTVSSKSYQETCLRNGLPDSKEFLDDLRSLAAADQVRGYVLFDGEKPVAYLCCPSRDRVLEYQYLGYDPDYMEWSVGTLLLWHALQAAFSEGSFKLFDFAGGQSDQTRLFATHKVPCANIYILRRNLRHAALIQGHRFISKFSRLTGEFLEGVGLKSRIRSWMRFWLSEPLS